MSRAVNARVAPATLEYRLESMDCPSCVRKIETAMERTPGASNARANLTTGTLTVTLDETRTPRAELERTLRGLGHAPQPVMTASTRHPRDAAPWHATRQGRLVIASGALLAAAYGFSFAEPRLATWGYATATLLGTAPLARKAVAAARAGDPFSINTLVTLAALGALLIGEAAEAAVVVFFFALGELLEGVATRKARTGIQALARLAPTTARVLHAGGVTEQPVATLEVGTLVQVQPGDRVPADGTVVSGASHVNEAPVTGESVPAAKSVGDTVYAGSINTDGVLAVRVERVASDNTIARILHLVEEAEAARAPVARFIDRFSRAYTPVVVLIAVLTAVIPMLLLGQYVPEALYRGVALLLIGCPCALVLSVPAAITSALSAGARHGLLVKGGLALETIGSVRTIAFDKTGTLTEGRPRVTHVIPLAGTQDDVLRLAAGIESGSRHPLARAVAERAAHLRVPPATDARAIPGKAVTATIDGRAYAIGSPRYARETNRLTETAEAHVAALEAQGHTVIVLLDAAAPRGLIALRDEPRRDAAAAVATLRALGVRPVMLTGDNARTARALAADLDIDAYPELLPEDKLRVVEQLMQGGKVAMVGDGINDAPALAGADVGVAMGGGTDVALDTADAALLHQRVNGVADLVRLSRATMRNIRQNIAFAVGLKAVFLVTTLVGLTGLWPAILTDTGATALVTANALRLLAFRPHEGADA